MGKTPVELARSISGRLKVGLDDDDDDAAAAAADDDAVVVEEVVLEGKVNK